MSDEGSSYKTTWEKEDPLYILNIRLHDGVKKDQLWDRAINRRDILFTQCFPEAQPAPGARILEIGSGVGWIMQAVLDGYPESHITGLDISMNCMRMARKRWQDPRASFVQYDGETFPFANNSFDNIYSVSCIQHIEKHAAFLIFEEIFRTLKVGGHATLHLLSFKHIPLLKHSYHEECKIHTHGIDKHWMHFYTTEELEILLTDVIGVSGLIIKPVNTSLLVHFRKPA